MPTQLKREPAELKFLRTRLGRIIRDIRRKIARNPVLEDSFGQSARPRAPCAPSGAAPARAEGLFVPRAEVECLGRAKARARYEFGCKVSITTPVTAPKGGQFVLHAKALHDSPDDGRTLGPIIADLEVLTGVTVRRNHVDKGYHGHTYPDRFKVWISGQVPRVTKAIRPRRGILGGRPLDPGLYSRLRG